MTTRIDYLSARFEAYCLNLNYHLKRLFGSEYEIDKHLPFSLQFSSITDSQAKQLNNFSDLPKNIEAYINSFDDIMTDEEFNDPHYSFRVLHVPKTANTKGKADCTSPLNDWTKLINQFSH